MNYTPATYGQDVLKLMDEAGITMQVLSNTGPGPDLVPGPDGEPLVLEVELTQPSLFLTAAGGAAERVAAAIGTRLG